MEILHIENTFSVIHKTKYIQMLKNHQQETPEDHLEDSGSHLSTCESRIGCLPHPSHTSTQTQVAWTPVSPLGVPLHHVGTWQMLTNVDKCPQMSTSVQVCQNNQGEQRGRPSVWDKCLRWSAKIISFEWQLQWSMTGITGWYSKHQTCEQLAKKLDTGPIPMPKTSQ